MARPLHTCTTPAVRTQA
ncbi:TPA_asm: UL49 uORF [Human alphaherpesvirus 1]|nr:TPA_asm: UL49 uORF [Human alphaherpesvirus 1]